MTRKTNKISDFSVILIFVFFTIVGLAMVKMLPLKLAPSHQLPRIYVNFSMHGSAPIVVETEVTSKLEAMISRVAGIRKMSSNSGNGWGSISVELDRHVDPGMARFEVASIIRQIWNKLPDNVSYPLVSMRQFDDKAPKNFLSYSLVAPVSSFELQQYAEKTIKLRLSDIEGLHSINVSGANPMEWQLEYDSEIIKRLGVSTNDIRSAINLHFKYESLGLIVLEDDVDGQNHLIPLTIIPTAYTERPLEDELRDIVIKKNETGRLIRLEEVIKLRRVESQPGGYYRINGQNTVYLTMVAEESANQLELAAIVKSRLADIVREFPAGYSVRNVNDATEYIRDELRKIYFRTGLTLLILLFFVALVYRNIRYILLIVFTLLITLAISFIIYYFAGVEIHLYSLAGITISLTLIIDNIIMLSDQIINQGNKKAFLSILAASVTTIGALVIIFFLEENIRLNLKDFAIVIMINLAVSLLVALFLVPALLRKMKIEKRIRRMGKKQTDSLLLKLWHRLNSLRTLVYINRAYVLIISFMLKRKWLFFVIIILLFGLPVFMMPDRIAGESVLAKAFNQTIGSSFYKDKMRVHVNNVLGGTWRLFVQKVYKGSYYQSNREETSLFVGATLPHGATLAQMNYLIQGMEAFIAGFEGVRQFETSIQSANRANISIRFNKEHQRGGFPHQLKNRIISKSLELGGGSWSVYGVGDGFSNDIRENAGSYRIVMHGYNYDELYVQAGIVKERLLEYRRIKEVEINSEFSWYKDDYREFSFEINHERLASEGIQAYQLYAAIQPVFEKRMFVSSLKNGDVHEHLVLVSKQSAEYNVWDFEHTPVNIAGKDLKMSELLSMTKSQAPRTISKENQQYRLCIQYEYIGAYEQGRRVMHRVVEQMQDELPVGYSIRSEQSWYRWGEEGNKHYWLLGVIAIIIYFCSGILFNSLKQPFHILFIIPLSFIGIFLGFYWYKVNFDQGGFAAFILLSGLTVNSNIYLISEFNNIMKRRKISSLRAYVKAWNAKVRPVFLTIISTMIGFLPFIISFREAFWYPLAVGAIGGLFVSFIITMLYLPLFLIKSK